METQARPEDVLLAYDDDFTGFTAMNEMAQPLEPVSGLEEGALGGSPPMLSADAGLGVGTLGGTPDPDGYYQDFTTRLAELSRKYPRARTGGGSEGPAIDWGALVITLDYTDSDEEPAAAGGEFGDGGSDGAPGDDEGLTSELREEPVAPDIVSLGAYIVESEGVTGESEGVTGESEGATGGTSPVISFGEYIVEAEGGKAPKPSARHNNIAVGEILTSDLEGTFGDEGDDAYSAFEGDDDAYGAFEGDDDDYSAFEGDDDAYGAFEGDDDAYGAFEGDADSTTYGGDENADSATYGGEMDESELETAPFEIYQVLPLDLNRPEPLTIVGDIITV